MQTLGYQLPTGYTRGPTTYLTYSLPPYTTVSQMMLLGDYTVDYRISYSHVILPYYYLSGLDSCLVATTRKFLIEQEQKLTRECR